MGNADCLFLRLAQASARVVGQSCEAGSQERLFWFCLRVEGFSGLAAISQPTLLQGAPAGVAAGKRFPTRALVTCALVTCSDPWVFLADTFCPLGRERSSPAPGPLLTCMLLDRSARFECVGDENCEPHCHEQPALLCGPMLHGASPPNRPPH